MTLFLTSDEIKELTGVRGGKPGRTREQRQADCLRSMKIPFHLNAAGRPVVVRAFIEGKDKKEMAAPAWEPAFGHG
ncbi:DUF4224 domain-containing protein [Comamonas odontotermitis]|uniref:DUF4224 domain-containing protein n=1 Tax=Comamonas odontotermitis TaxID=379895 RepID=UPI001CC6B528|nr:DUF4224 domain-containing protein [Comamonas odontotermitis]UBB18311.1 DUF4224 domain-containing protein [Comamonas odontotermitis]